MVRSTTSGGHDVQATLNNLAKKEGQVNPVLLFRIETPLHRTPDELHQVGLHLLQRGHMDIHHMPGFVIPHADILLQALDLNPGG